MISNLFFSLKVRISISSICYIRDIFPHDCFKKKEYGSIDIHQLQGAHKDEGGIIVVNNYEAFLLTQWLEKGVFMALETEYLYSLTFAIYSKHPVTREDIVLETYEFKVTFPESGPSKVNDVPILSKDSVKTQAALFIRSLTEFAGTLDLLPSERWITLQLKVTLTIPQYIFPYTYSQNFYSNSIQIMHLLNMSLNFSMRVTAHYVGSIGYP